MADFQRILVVSTRAGASDVGRIRACLGAAVVVLTAPTGEAKTVALRLGRDAVPELVLAPVSHPDVDRGHRLDEVVRRYAVEDRFRDVVVVADPATVTLLLRVLAPDQLVDGGPATEVGLPRGSRPVPYRPAVAAGVGLAVVAGLMSSLAGVWALPALVLVAGLALLLVPGRRHLGQALLLAVAVAVLVTVLSVAGSSRFPGSW